jgi:hypothetical protein
MSNWQWVTASKKQLLWWPVVCRAGGCRDPATHTRHLYLRVKEPCLLCMSKPLLLLVRVACVCFFLVSLQHERTYAHYNACELIRIFTLRVNWSQFSRYVWTDQNFHATCELIRFSRCVWFNQIFTLHMNWSEYHSIYELIGFSGCIWTDQNVHAACELVRIFMLNINCSDFSCCLRTNQNILASCELIRIFILHENWSVFSFCIWTDQSIHEEWCILGCYAVWLL